MTKTKTATLKQLIARHHIKIESKLTDTNPNFHSDSTEWMRSAHHYKVTLRAYGRQMTTYFSMGPALCEDPDAEGVLDCLLSDSPACKQDFAEWARDLGYDEDSRKAGRTYNACLKLGTKLKQFLGEHYEAFLYADRN